MEKREFLAVYDYGMGGLWFKIEAGSAEQIRARYPRLRCSRRTTAPSG